MFELDGASYALSIDSLVEVARRVHVTPLPAAPDVVLGLIVHRGVAVPAIDLRARLGSAARAPRLTDQMVVVRTPRRSVALVVDRIVGVVEIDADAVRAPMVRDRHVSGVAVVDGSVVLIEDLEALLSLDEEKALADAMERA